jgi:hypothetical protein
VNALVELLVGLRERQFAVDDFGADGLEDLPQFGLGPGGAEEPGRGADDGYRFVAQDVGGNRPGDPVESVLERAGDGCVVLRVVNTTASAPAI